jgi:adenine-specific DNA methylase
MAYIEHDFPIEGLNKIAQKEGNAKKPIYQMHKWWARRLGSVFRMLILAAFAEDDIHPTELWRRFYTRNQLLVTDPDGKKRPPIILDPFMGGGTTIVEALRLGCKVVGVDLNPVAWFVTKKEIEPVDLDALDAAFQQLEKTVAPKILRYYRTTCPLGHSADVMYVFWVKKVTCVDCGQEVRLFPSFRLATKKDVHTVFCPSCYQIFWVDDLNEETGCPECSHRFTPSKGITNRGKYTCSHCGQKESVLNAVRRKGEPPEAEMFAIEYYCPTCEREGYNRRGYKQVDDEDLALFAEAKAEFERRKDELPFPRQRVPQGVKTKDLLNYCYEYWHQMFNERQLLCLATLLEEILKIESDGIRELIILALSDCTNFNNMFCRYDPTKLHSTDLFSRHAYWPTPMPSENNVWGTKFGRNTFLKTYRKMCKGIQFALGPYERDGQAKRRVGDVVSAQLVQNTELLQDGGNALLKAQTAEDLSFIPDGSVDAVITDPPYCDNVMYSELADFFYVWLRLVLKDKYPAFEPELSPKAREIIKNDAQAKDENFFFRGLTRAFRECNRVLKDNGLFVFTFHHSQTWAWKSVLNSILEAGFYVTCVYPIHAEMSSSTHIMAGGIAYDIPFVCRKREESGQTISWEALKDEIYFAAQESVERIKTSGRSISDSDLFVIAMGRCLELYSKYWPNVFKAGQQVDVDQAVDDLDGLVDSLIKSYELKLLPASLDETTKYYLLYIAGQKTVSADELRKRLVTGGGNLDLFTKRDYLLTKRKRMIVATPEQRLTFIERELERDRDLPLIDIAHHLYATYKAGQPVQWLLGHWTRDELVAVLEHLYRKSGDRVWRSLAELTRQAQLPGPERLL